MPRNKKKRNKKNRRKAKIEISAGGVIYLKRKNKTKIVLLGKYEPFPTWRLPKGHIESFESQIEAARREVAEESGVSGTGGPKLGTVNFYFTHPRSKKFIHKYVHYYLFKKNKGSIYGHDKEHDVARWFTFDEAIKRATFENDKKMIRRARGIIKKRQHQNKKLKK